MNLESTRSIWLTDCQHASAQALFQQQLDHTTEQYQHDPVSAGEESRDVQSPAHLPYGFSASRTSDRSQWRRYGVAAPRGCKSTDQINLYAPGILKGVTLRTMEGQGVTDPAPTSPSHFFRHCAESLTNLQYSNLPGQSSSPCPVHKHHNLPWSLKETGLRNRM